MGTAGVEPFDVGTAAVDFARVMERGQRWPEPFPDVRMRLAQPMGILETHDSNDDDQRGLRDLAILPRFANSALGPKGTMGIVPIVISLSTGQ